MERGTLTILILFFSLLGLIALLIFLYKTLNKETNGEYTIRNMVYKEGGVRDQMRGVALTLGTRLGVQLWPHDDTEMQEVRDEEAEVQQSDSQVEKNEEKDGQGEKEDEEKEDSNSSDAESSVEGSEADEETRLTGEPERAKKDEEKEEEEEEEEEEKMEGEGSGGAEVLVNLNQFSGSATWSEEQGGKFGEVTPL